MTEESGLSGDDGELIDRLLKAANVDQEWAELGFWLIFAVGGKHLSRLVPDTGREPVPGSVGEERRGAGELVSRSRYFAEIRRRLTQLVQSGMREDVLVRALRDDMTSRLREFTKIDEPNRNREKLRKRFEKNASDPAELAKLRDMIAEREPDRAAQMSDRELAGELLRMSEGLAPIPVEGELEAWAKYDQWVDLTKDNLSDDLVSAWLTLRSRRDLH